MLTKTETPPVPNPWHRERGTATVTGYFIDTQIPQVLDGERLDRVVSMLGSCSRSAASDLIRAGTVAVNGSVVDKPAHRIVDGDHLVISEGPASVDTTVEADPSVEFVVVHEDDHLAVIDKPAGLVVHPGAGNPDGTLVNGLVHRFPAIAYVGDPTRPGIVHRLDAGTSGLMVVAKDQDAYTALVAELSQRTVHRSYTALVSGHPAHARGVIDAPIGRSRRDPLRMTVSADGREARTRYRVDEQFEEPFSAALLTCELETGRTHQIRVHLSSIGHPVVGDRRYGGRHIDLARPFLHARELSFVHPVTGDDVTVHSELPADLKSVLERFTPRNPAMGDHPR